MSKLPDTEAQWIKLVEQSCSEGKPETIVPQMSMSLDDAIHLAIRLDMALGLLGDDYIFRPGSPQRN